MHLKKNPKEITEKGNREGGEKERAKGQKLPFGKQEEM